MTDDAVLHHNLGIRHDDQGATEEVVIDNYDVVYDTEVMFGYVTRKSDGTPIPMAFLVLKSFDAAHEKVEHVFAFDPVDLAVVGADVASGSIKYARSIGEAVVSQLDGVKPSQPQRPDPTPYL